jgi:hypothetical protein
MPNLQERQQEFPELFPGLVVMLGELQKRSADASRTLGRLPCPILPGKLDELLTFQRDVGRLLPEIALHLHATQEMFSLLTVGDMDEEQSRRYWDAFERAISTLQELERLSTAINHNQIPF